MSIRDPFFAPDFESLYPDSRTCSERVVGIIPAARRSFGDRLSFAARQCALVNVRYIRPRRHWCDDAYSDNGSR